MKRFYTAQVFPFVDSSVADYAGEFRRINPLAVESIRTFNDKYSEVTMVSGQRFAVSYETADHLEKGFTACLQ